MNDQDRKLLDLIGQAVPQMDAAKKNELAAFLEGVAFATQVMDREEARAS